MSTRFRCAHARVENKMDDVVTLQQDRGGIASRSYRTILAKKFQGIIFSRMKLDS